MQEARCRACLIELTSLAHALIMGGDVGIDNACWVPALGSNRGSCFKEIWGFAPGYDGAKMSVWEWSDVWVGSWEWIADQRSDVLLLYVQMLWVGCALRLCLRAET